MQNQGTCLCGKISIRIENMNSEVGACHCSMCRKWTGGPFVAADCGKTVEISDNDKQLSLYDSSAWAQRAFCKNCGTSLFYRLKHDGRTMVSVGLLENQKVDFHHEIFIDEKPEFYTFGNDTKKMTGAEVIAQSQQ